LIKVESISDGVIELAQGKHFEIREIGLGTKSKVGLIPSGLNYIVKAYRGEPLRIHTHCIGG